MRQTELRAAIFDFGGVMTEPLFRDLVEEASDELRGLVAYFLADFRDVYHLTNGAHDIHRLETGEIDDAEFFERLCHRYHQAGNPRIDSGRAQAAIWGREFAACGAMEDAVRQLRAAGLRTGMLTNISRGGEAVWSQLIPAAELFDVVVDSSRVGMRKPDPRIYHVMCERLEVAPHECLFVDDLACNVEAAAGLGMTTVHCYDPVECADDIVRLVLGHEASDEGTGEATLSA